MQTSIPTATSRRSVSIGSMAFPISVFLSRSGNVPVLQVRGLSCLFWPPNCALRDISPEFGVEYQADGGDHEPSY